MQARFSQSAHPLRQASGEQLLLMAILGNAAVRRHIHGELDRRARLTHRPADTATPRPRQRPAHAA